MLQPRDSLRAMMTPSTPMKPLSLLLISDSYPPVMGGSEVEAQRIASAMIRRGHRVQVLCAGGPPMPAVREWVDPAGVPVRILTRRSRGRWKDLFFAMEVAWALWRDRNRYDVVYFLMQGLHLADRLAGGSRAWKTHCDEDQRQRDHPRNGPLACGPFGIEMACQVGRARDAVE